MNKIGRSLERLGAYVMLLGGVLIAAIFLTVLLYGTWPEFLSPVQDAAKFLSAWVGGFVWLVWIAVFIGPGWLLQIAGQKMQSDK